MHYPVLVNPRKPSLSRMPMKKPKRASAAKAEKGRKTSASRSKAAAKPPARPSRRRTQANGATESIKATIRGLRSKLKAAERRVAELEAAADTDFLLEIPNRRGFERELNRAIAYMKRYRASGALIVLDVDGLKPINDSFGHAAGDEVLKAIAATLTRQVRASDVVGRLGGDEFALRCGISARPTPKRRPPRSSRRSTNCPSPFGASMWLRAPPPASRCWGRSPTQAAPSRKPTPPCMCARRAGGTSRGPGWPGANSKARRDLAAHCRNAQQCGVAEFAGHGIAAAAKRDRADVTSAAR